MRPTDMDSQAEMDGPLSEQGSREDRIDQNWTRALGQVGAGEVLRDSMSDAGRFGGTQTIASTGRDLGLKPPKGDFCPCDTTTMMDGD